MRGNTLIVSVVGQLVLANKAEFKKLVVGRLEQADVEKVVCDLTQCDYIDGAGLGVLVSVNNQLKERNNKGNIRLAGLNEDLITLFKLTKLDTLFDVQPIGQPVLARDAFADPEE